MIEVINAKDFSKWRMKLNILDKVDVCHLPEYHYTYCTRMDKSEALLWCYEKDDNSLFYPFLMAPVSLTKQDGSSETTKYYDISSVYGFSGPISTTQKRSFLDAAWDAFDKWAIEKKIICEFIRFSTYVGNHELASKKCFVEMNRPVSISLLPKDPEVYLSELHSKTRNMVRRAKREGLVARSVLFEDGIEDFRKLYFETMARNGATGFFSYDDDYYNNLMKLPADELYLYGVYSEGKMVAASIALVHENYAFYHLGASEREMNRVGAGNLVLYAMACDLMTKGITYLNVGGGRTVDNNDPLFIFKKSNGTSVDSFYIGKRILEKDGYDSVVKQWESHHGKKVSSNQLQFYR